MLSLTFKKEDPGHYRLERSWNTSRMPVNTEKNKFVIISRTQHRIVKNNLCQTDLISFSDTSD